MRRIFRTFCVPLIQINYNVYTFISGILISLATNIFATLCFESFDWSKQWHQYLSVIMFGMSSALCLYLSTKMSNIQNYISSKRKRPEERKAIIIDVTDAEYKKWLLVFLGLLISIVAGIALLLFNFIYSV